MEFICVTMIVFLFIDDTKEDIIASLDSTKNVLEDASVTFSCKYTVDINSVHWYRLYPGATPEFILFITEYNTTGGAPPRMLSHINKDTKHVILEISSAEVLDSAVYYCAVLPTMTGNIQTLYKNLISTWCYLL
ncbi:hypothetical protein AALO_G00004880 [Alosa alosa]|uniref:Ig-like domain-containing protein n=1 Tax=Alosa alosa TaxID=278164 RepID=A0AAV6HED0_9TELE|nr:hypothetical protein AALO_G00004880 [Alosa alosa]